MQDLYRVAAAGTAPAADVRAQLAILLADVDTDSTSVEMRCRRVVGSLIGDLVEDDPDRALVGLDEAGQLASAMGEVGRSLAVHVALARAVRLRQKADSYAAVATLEARLADVAGVLAEQRVRLIVDLADVLMEVGRNREADAHLARVLDGPDAGQIAPDMRCRISGLRGQIYLHLGLPDVAERALGEQWRAAERLREVDGPRADAVHQEAVLRRLHLYLATDRPRQVVDLIDKVRAPGYYAKVSAPIDALFRLRRGLALAELSRGGAEWVDAAVGELRDAVDDVLPSDRLCGLLALTELALRRHDHEEARSLIDRVDERFRSMSGAVAGEYAQWNAYRAALRSDLMQSSSSAAPAERAAALADLQRAYDGLLDEWSRDSWRAEGIAFLHFGARCYVTNELIRAHAALVGGKRGQEAGLEVLLRAQVLATVTRARGAVVPSVAAACAVLAEGELQLCYLTAPERLTIFVLDRSGVQLVSCALPARFYGEVREFARLSARVPSQEVSEAARGARRTALDALGERILATVFPGEVRVRVENATALTIVGVEMLSHLPFDALPWAGSQLGRRVALAYMPSVPFGVAVSAAPRRADSACELAVFAAPTHGNLLSSGAPRLSPLELGDGDVHRLARAYRPDAVQVWRGDAATLEGLRSAAAVTHSVLQVWTHGVHDAERERPAGLMVASSAECPQGNVWYEQVMDLHPPALVVLAACRAARGPVRRGEDVVAGLDAALLRGGADVVVVPSADAEEGATLRLLETFHEALRNGDTPAEAMRLARDRLARDPRYEDPFYHCLVHVVGNGQRPVFARRPPPDPKSARSRWWWVGAIGPVLIGSVLIGLMALQRLRREPRT